MMLARLPFAITLGVACLASASAFASVAPSPPSATYELAPDPLTVGTVSTSPTIVVGSGTTVDDFTFSLANTYATSSTGLFFEMPTFGLEINSADLTLYEGTPASPGAELADTGVFNPTTTTATLGAVLSSGDYFVQSTVSIPAGESGAFSVAATVSSAPEPASWLLMILGVGMIGLALRQIHAAVGLRRGDAVTAS